MERRFHAGLGPRLSMRGTRLAWLPFLACVLLTGLFGGSAQAEMRESRVLFNEDFVWITRAGTDRLLDRMKQAGFNVLIPCIWHGSGVSWPSSLAQKDPRWVRNRDLRNPDPLNYLITKAHQQGIEVHPWFTVSLRGSEFTPEYADPGTPERTFDLHKPEIRDLIVRLVLEVVENYPVDGINLDYIRTRGICESESCVARYRQETGRMLRVDIVASRFEKAAAESIAAWNRKVTSDIVQRVHEGVRRVKPNVLLSVDSIAGVWLEQGAASTFWADQGWIDLIFHMDYKPPEAVNRTLLAQARQKISDPKKLTLLPGNFENPKVKGLSSTPRDARKVVALIDLARQLTPESRTAALYTYELLTDEQIRLIRTGPFAEPAQPIWPQLGEQR